MAWTIPHTRLLLQFYYECYRRDGKANWPTIVERFHEIGVARTESACMSKFKHMKRNFRKQVQEAKHPPDHFVADFFENIGCGFDQMKF
jgi:hypothetical protein